MSLTSEAIVAGAKGVGVFVKENPKTSVGVLVGVGVAGAGAGYGAEKAGNGIAKAALGVALAYAAFRLLPVLIKKL